jgi:TRAP transporter 4TM/12TM fusion protein
LTASEDGPAVGRVTALRQPLARGIANALATLLTLGSVAWALDLPLWLRLDLYPAQFFAGMLALALPLCFIALPARRTGDRTRVPWYDALFGVAGMVAVGYLTWKYQALVDLIMLRPRDAVAAGIVTIVLTLEGLRRATGWALPVIAGSFLAYALWGDTIPGQLAARATDWQKLSTYLALDVNGVLGVPLAVASTIVLAFLLFGELLNASRGTRFFTDIAMLTMGRFRGGPAKMAVVGSALFGSVSGSAVANVVATGVITIPLIKRSGYPPHKAAAIEAVASTGGQMMPPVMGASAFLMAEFLQIPYREVVLAALLPAILYYVALFIQADLDAARMGIAAIDRRQMPPPRAVLPGLYFLLPFVLLIVVLFNFNQSPQLAALIAAALLIPLAFAFGYRGERPAWRAFIAAVPAAGYAALDIILVCAAAGMVIGVLGISGLGYNLTASLVEIGEGSLVTLLVLTAVVCIVLGMGLPTVGVYVLLAALVAPALVKVGVSPIAAHLYVMYFGMMSMITPPVAIAAFAAAGLAGADPMRTGWAAVGFGWTAFVVPVLFVLSPQLLLIGEPWDVALAVVTAVVGVWLVAIAITGYFLRPLSPGWRLAFAVAGLLALIPAGAFPGAVYTDIAGVLAGIGLIGREIRIQRRARAA